MSRCRSVPTTSVGPYIVYFVLLDEELRSAFRTVSREKAEAARQGRSGRCRAPSCRSAGSGMLTQVFGHDRVSVMRFGESDLEEYRELLQL